MTVEFLPKSADCFCFGAPNGHVFELLKTQGFKEIFGELPLTNDPIDATAEQSRRLAKYIKDNSQKELKNWPADADMYADFFERCEGFSTF